MSIRDLKYLKELSWYTTVPLFVCAWMLQDINSIGAQLTSLWGFVSIVGEYFVKVLGILLIAYIVWLFSAVRLEKEYIPFTLLLATFLLTMAGVGFAVFFIKPESISLPLNIVWFAAFASVAFNLYEINAAAHNTYEPSNVNKQQ